MNLLIFLNELSQSPIATDVRSGRSRMELFIRTFIQIKNSLKVARPVLRLRDDFDTVVLAPEYPIGRWRNDLDVPRDLRVRLKQLIAQSPLLIRGQDPAALMETALTSQILHQGRHASGLSAAHAAGGLGVSFISDVCWDCAWINVNAEHLNAEGAIETHEVPVRHASRDIHINVHCGWLNDFERHVIRDGQDLWDRRQDLFPTLEFCNETKKQLALFRGGDPELVAVVNRLIDLHRSFDAWMNHEAYATVSFPFHIVSSKCTPEGEATLSKFATEHTFTRPTGQRILFSWHVRFTPGAGRIFFSPDDDLRKGIIGYIGKNKLPNATYD